MNFIHVFLDFWNLFNFAKPLRISTPFDNFFSRLARPTAELDRPHTSRSAAKARHELAPRGRSARVR